MCDSSREHGPEINTLVMIEHLGPLDIHTALGNERARETATRHNRLVRDLLPRFEGREIEKAGRFLLLFERPIDAVGYALAYQEASATLGKEFDCPLAGRIGIHVGEVFLRENPPDHVARGAKPLELEGPARPMVARLMSLAGGGQTLLTKAAFLLARRSAVGDDALEDCVAWVSHGPYRFAGVDEVLEVFEVGVRGVAPLTAPRPPLKSDPRRATGVSRLEGAEVWRPAEGEPIPHRPNWMLSRPLDEAIYGEVWLGRHRKTGDRQAFRFCYDAADLPRMQHQLAVVRHLRQTLGDRQVAARTIDSQLDEAPYFLESEHVGGSTLAAWAEARDDLGEVPIETCLEIVAQIAELVAVVHGAGVAIGNVRPINLLVEERSDSIHKVLMADLSQARIVSVETTADTTVTDLSDRDPTLVYYMPPEHDGHQAVSQTGDVYALGILLYQLIAGDFDRPLGPFWERDVDDELLREEIARLADPDPLARPRDAAEAARRLRDLESRRAELEAEQPESEEKRQQGLWGGLLRRR